MALSRGVCSASTTLAAWRQLFWSGSDRRGSRSAAVMPVDRVGGACAVQKRDGKRAVPAAQLGPGEWS